MSPQTEVLWEPQPKQAQALSCPAFEMLFGGAAGGGKSDFLLADFLGGLNEWGADWRGILFRKTYPELEDIIARAQQIYLPLGAVYKIGERTFRFPNGAYLRMRSLDNEMDVTKYQGSQYTWIGFDELGLYSTDYCWMYMRSRCRSAAGAPCFMRATANPGGPGNNWIKNRWIDGFLPNKIYRDSEGLTRCFIPSLLKDNKILMTNNPQYERQLRGLPSHLRRALLEGDWDVVAGQVFDEWRRDKHVIRPRALPQDEWFRFYAFDWGYKSPYGIVKLAVNSGGKIIQYGEMYGCIPGEVNKGK